MMNDGVCGHGLGLWSVLSRWHVDCSRTRKICLLPLIASPIPDHAFFKQTDFEGLLGDDLFQLLRRSVFTSPVLAARSVSPARRRLPASKNSFDPL